MPRDFPRAARLADQIQRDLSDLIRFEVKDPRVGMVTITSVEVTRDLAHAKVYITSLGDTASTEQAVDALQHASGFLRTQIARTVKTRVAPQLQFIYDASVERGVRLSSLIDEAVADSERWNRDEQRDDH
ncbi:MAG: 30S ribosome-binding factor RbfA [Betaproteobacteria bacterium]